MTKKQKTYDLSNPTTFKHQLIHYLRQFNCFCVLDSNSESIKNSFDFLAAFKRNTELLNSSDVFLELENIITQSKDWVVGYLG